MAGAFDTLAPLDGSETLAPPRDRASVLAALGLPPEAPSATAAPSQAPSAPSPSFAPAPIKTPVSTPSPTLAPPKRDRASVLQALGLPPDTAEPAPTGTTTQNAGASAADAATPDIYAYRPGETPEQWTARQDAIQAAGGFWGGVKELGKSVARGVYQVPEFVGDAASGIGRQMGLVDPMTPEQITAQQKQRAADLEALPAWMQESELSKSQEHPYGSLADAGQSLVQSFGPTLAGAAAGAAATAWTGPGAAVGAGIGALVGTIAGLIGAGGQQAESSYQAIKQATNDEDAALKGGLISGSIDAGGEALADVVLLKAGRLMPRSLRDGITGAIAKRLGMEPPPANMIEKMASNKNAIWGAAKDTALKILPAEVGTELLQQVGEQGVESYYGAGPMPTWDDAKRVIVPTMVMTGLSAGAVHSFGAAQRAHINKVLSQPGDGSEQSLLDRSNAMARIEAEVRKSDPQLADIWREYASASIADNKPMVIDEDAHYAGLMQQAVAENAKRTGGAPEASAPSAGTVPADSAPSAPPSAPLPPASRDSILQAYLTTIPQTPSDQFNDQILQLHKDLADQGHEPLTGVEMDSMVKARMAADAPLRQRRQELRGATGNVRDVPVGEGIKQSRPGYATERAPSVDPATQQALDVLTTNPPPQEQIQTAPVQPPTEAPNVPAPEPLATAPVEPTPRETAAAGGAAEVAPITGGILAPEEERTVIEKLRDKTLAPSDVASYVRTRYTPEKSRALKENPGALDALLAQGRGETLHNPTAPSDQTPTVAPPPEPGATSTETSNGQEQEGRRQEVLTAPGPETAPVRPYASVEDRESAIARLIDLAKNSDNQEIALSDREIRDAVEYGASESEVQNAIVNGDPDLISSILIKYEKKSKGLKQGFGSVPYSAPANLGMTGGHPSDDYANWEALTDDQVNVFAKAAGVRPGKTKLGTLDKIDELARRDKVAAWDRAFKAEEAGPTPQQPQPDPERLPELYRLSDIAGPATEPAPVPQEEPAPNPKTYPIAGQQKTARQLAEFWVSRNPESNIDETAAKIERRPGAWLTEIEKALQTRETERQAARGVKPWAPNERQQLALEMVRRSDGNPYRPDDDNSRNPMSYRNLSRSLRTLVAKGVVVRQEHADGSVSHQVNEVYLTHLRNGVPGDQAPKAGKMPDQMVGADTMVSTAPKTRRERRAAQKAATAPAGAMEGTLQQSLADWADEQDRIADDWAARQYKANGRVIEFEGDGPLRNGTISVAGANERRRTKRVQEARRMAKAARAYAKKPEAEQLEDYRRIHAAVQAYDSDVMRVHFGKDGQQERQQALENALNSELFGVDGASGAVTPGSVFARLMEPKRQDATKQQPTPTFTDAEIQASKERIDEALAKNPDDWLGALFGESAGKQPTQTAPVPEAAMGERKGSETTAPIRPDSRLNIPDIRDLAARRVQEIGWQEEGGRIIRGADGQVSGRTTWVPTVAIEGKPADVTAAAVKSAWAKTEEGTKLNAAERRALQWLLDTAEKDVVNAKIPGNIDILEPGAAERDKRQVALRSQGVDALGEDAYDELLDRVSETSDREGRDDEQHVQAIEQALKEAIDNARQRQTDQGSREQGERDGAFGLTGQTPADLEAQRRADEQRARDEAAAAKRAEVDRQAEPFVLSGSNRPVDEAEARGQGNLFDQPKKAEPSSPTAKPQEPEPSPKASPTPEEIPDGFKPISHYDRDGNPTTSYAKFVEGDRVRAADGVRGFGTVEGAVGAEQIKRRLAVKWDSMGTETVENDSDLNPAFEPRSPATEDATTPTPDGGQVADGGSGAKVSDADASANPNIRFALADKPSTSERDAEYLSAVARGDLKTARRLVDEAAADSGYANNSDAFRMSHRAPDREDSSLLTVRNSDLVPQDYWKRPDLYQSSPEEMESWHAVMSAFRRYDARQKQGKASDPRITVYRAVPKSVKENTARNGDWVTPSREYAMQEGRQIPGGYRIIETSAKLSNLWWDGNSIAELGFDDGHGYAYSNTKNNRKLLDPVTYDDDGNVIQLSKRFQKRNEDPRFALSTRPLTRRPASANRGEVVSARVLDATLQADPLVRGLKRTHGVGVRAVQREQDMPQAARDELARVRRENPNAMPKAVWVRDPMTGASEIVLVADNIRGVREGRKLAFEEAVGHFGLTGMLGDQFGGFLDAVVAERNADVAAYADQYNLDMESQDGRRRAAEEYLAHTARLGSEADRGLLERLYQAIRRALRALGVNLRLSDGDLREIVAAAHRYAVGAPGAMRGARGMRERFGGQAGERSQGDRFATGTDNGQDMASAPRPENAGGGAETKIGPFDSDLKSLKPGERLWLRYGTVPESGKSRHVQHGFEEDGVSVILPLEALGKDARSKWWTMQLVFSMTAGEMARRDLYVVAGKQRKHNPYAFGESGFGSDGEPLLESARVVRKATAMERYQLVNDMSIEAEKMGLPPVPGGLYAVLNAEKPENAGELSMNPEQLPTTIDVDGVQRPTTNSEGQPIHPTEDGVRNFWRWDHNGPKDEDGRPIIFYHGGDKNFTQINQVGRFLGSVFVREGKPSHYRSKDYALYLRAPILELSELQDELNTKKGQQVLRDILGNDIDDDALERVSESLTDGSHYPNDESIWEIIGAIDESDAQIEIQKLRGKVANKLGFSAVRTPDEFDGETVMVVDAYNIKSATENTGAFSPDNPDIRFALGSGATAKLRSLAGRAGIPGFPGQPSVSVSGQAFGVQDNPTWLDTLVYNLQDRFASLKKVQKALGPLPDDQDPYLAETLFHGKNWAAHDDFAKAHVEPIEKLMADNNLPIAKVDEFLYARHAPEANARLRQTNAKRFLRDLIEATVDTTRKQTLSDAMAKIVSTLKNDPSALRDEYLNLLDGAVTAVGSKSEQMVADRWAAFRAKPSGMTNAEADAILTANRGNKALQEIGQRIDAMTQAHIDRLEAGGLLTAKEADAWRNTYRHYVTLAREGFEDTMPKQGRGKSIGGRESKIRAGSTRRAVDILANTIARSEAGITRVEKAKVGRALYELVKANPDEEGFWTVDKDEQRAEYDSTGNIVFYPDALEGDNQIKVKIDGVQHTVTFDETNPHAMRIASAMKNLDQNQGSLVDMLSTVNRALAFVNTSASPEFLISNLARDVQTAIYNLQSTEAGGLARKIVKDIPDAMKGIREALRDGTTNSEWAKWWKDFERNGGPTGWADAYRSIEERAKRIEANVSRLAGHKPRRYAHATLKLIEDYNAIVENATRLAAYRNAVERGLLSHARAAAMAKDLTTNFNRKGASGQILNSLYLFANAGIQGSARILTALHDSPKVRQMAYATMGIAAALSMANRGIGGDDDDGESYYDKVPDYVKERNMIFMLPGTQGKYVKIPLPWGYNVLWAMGDGIGNATDAALGNNRGFNSTKELGKIVGATLNAFNPLQSGTLLQTVAPTLLDPLVQIGENKNWAGQPLAPERNSFDPVGEPNFERYWQSSRPISRAVAKGLSYATGGNRVEGGFVDLSPEWVDLAIDTVTGSAGRFVVDAVSTPAKALSGESIEGNDIPFLRRVFGTQPENAAQQIYFVKSRDVQVAKEKMDAYKGDPQALSELRSENSSLLSLVGQQKRADSVLRRLRKERNAARDSGDKAREKAILERMNAVYDRFNTEYNRQVLGE